MPQLTLVIGNKNYSSWSLRPWIFLHHFGIPFAEQRIPLDTDQTIEQLRHYHSGYKVPILLDDKHEVWDSLAILEYLSENYANGKGWPADSNARSIARSVSAEMHSSFTALRTELPMNCRRKVEGLKLSSAALKEIKRIEWIWNYCRDNFAPKDNPDKPWLFGDFSIADAMFAPVAIRFNGYCVTVNNTSQCYVDSVINHPAIQQWVTAAELETEVLEREEVLAD